MKQQNQKDHLNQTNKNAEQGAVANPLRRRSSQVL